MRALPVLHAATNEVLGLMRMETPAAVGETVRFALRKAGKAYVSAEPPELARHWVEMQCVALEGVSRVGDHATIDVLIVDAHPREVERIIGFLPARD
jgi:hypothetical protein